MRDILRNILRDIKIGLGDGFDRNFERQGFFNEAWERKHSPVNAGSPILIHTGTLRRSIKSRTTDNSIVFYSDLPYAAIHNDGGIIVVTARMKRYFWAKYYETCGAFGRKKNGERRNDKRTNRLTGEADFWQAMALMRVGRQIKIPRRRFLGASPEVEASVREIIEANLTEYFEKDFKVIIR